MGNDQRRALGDAVLAHNAFNYANGLLGGVTPDAGFFPKVTATYSF